MKKRLFRIGFILILSTICTHAFAENIAAKNSPILIQVLLNLQGQGQGQLPLNHSDVLSNLERIEDLKIRVENQELSSEVLLSGDTCIRIEKSFAAAPTSDKGIIFTYLTLILNKDVSILQFKSTNVDRLYRNEVVNDEGKVNHELLSQSSQQLFELYKKSCTTSFHAIANKP